MTDTPAMQGARQYHVKNSVLSIGKVDSIIYLTPCRVDTGDKHHLVAVIALHDCLIYLLDIFLTLHAGIVDIEDNESIFYTGFLKLAVAQSGHLYTRCKLVFLKLLLGKRLERASERSDILSFRHLCVALTGYAESHRLHALCCRGYISP